MKLAIYPGSFDPVTFGHLDIIQRAAALFERVIVLVSVNQQKTVSFTAEERVDFLRRVTANIAGVTVDASSGLLVDYFREKNADVIVKGLRAMSDFETEFQMALVNKDLCPKAETVFLSADAASTFLSSSMVKQIVSLGGDVSSFVPANIMPDIKKRLQLK